ncbi:C-type lectin protein [Cladochytrium replicatum]|nr:C-type lectin protein [Cladochytrium replicatum]
MASVTAKIDYDPSAVDQPTIQKITAAQSFARPAPVEVIDIRTTLLSNTNDILRTSILESLVQKNVRFKDAKSSDSPEVLLRSIPTLVLYDDKGLDIFDEITYLDEYYLTNAEINVFQRYADAMVSRYVKDGGVLVELGVGSMRKTKYFLDAVVRQGKTITYYALDLSLASLRNSLDAMATAFPSLHFVGLLGTYHDSQAYIREHIDPSTPKLILWLGSSIGNLTRDEAAVFLRSQVDSMSVGDHFLCGIDRRNDKKVVGLAYNDPKGVTREFVMNGLDAVNDIFDERVFDRTKFEYVSIYNDVEGRHEAYYEVLVDHVLKFRAPSSPEVRSRLGVSSENDTVEIQICKGEMINIEYSYKYNEDEVRRLVHDSGLYRVAQFTDDSDRYDLHMFQKPPFAFRMVSMGDKRRAVPTLDEWNELWKAWDTVTMGMIPRANSELGVLGHDERPISLRHPYIFYLGHIPCFLDIQISKSLGLPLAEPSYYAQIFERGIDPDMEDPTKCHDHSEVPDSWPKLDDILRYRDNVRSRVKDLVCRYHSGEYFGMASKKRMGRVLFMCYEHEAMHLETVLYMLVQSPNFLPPPGFSPPFLRVPHTPLPVATFKHFDTQSLTYGVDDEEKLDEGTDDLPSMFGWDNEKPKRTVTVPAFSIQERPVTVAEYRAFLDSHGWDEALIPASWTELKEPDGSDDDDDATASVSSSDAQRRVTSTPPPLSSPAHSSASSYGVKTVFSTVPLHIAAHWPVFVSGAQAMAYADAQGLRLPSELEVSVLHANYQSLGTAANVGFTSWTPKDVKSQEGMGNGWEWSCTVFGSHAGFEESSLYPGYSKDFFDGKHWVLKGGSWATVPRIAERLSFRNWYQEGYPYVFATFRCCEN